MEMGSQQCVMLLDRGGLSAWLDSLILGCKRRPEDGEEILMQHVMMLDIFLILLPAGKGIEGPVGSSLGSANLL